TDARDPIIGNEGREGSTENFQGYIDELRISSTARSAQNMIFPASPIGLNNVTVIGPNDMTVTFTGAVSTSALNAANYTVSGDGQGTLADNPDSVSYLGDNVYQLTWNSGIQVGGADITITANVTDVFGGLITPNFATDEGGAIGDVDAPTITMTGSITGGDVSTAVVFTWNYSDPTGTSGTVQIVGSRDGGSTRVVATADSDDANVSWLPSAPGDWEFYATGYDDLNNVETGPFATEQTATFTFADAGSILGPYTATGDTLHLYHLDDAGTTSTDDGNAPDDVVGLLGDAALSEPSFPGFSTCLNNGTDSLSAASLGNGIDFQYFVGTNQGWDQAFTIEALIRLDVDLPASHNMQIFSIQNGSNRLHFRIQGTNLYVENINWGPGDVTVALPTSGAHAPVKGRWYHVAITHEGTATNVSTFRVYWTDLIQGAADQQANLLIQEDNEWGQWWHADNHGPRIGNDGDGGENFEGLIDELRISGVALPANGMMFGDPTAPNLTDVTVLTSQTVQVVFSELMNATADVAANYAVTGSGAGTLATNPDSVSNVGNTTYTLTWTGGEMLDGGDITITATGVEKSNGTPIALNSATDADGGIGIAPEANLNALAESTYQGGDVITLSWTSSDIGSGVASVELFYIANGGSAVSIGTYGATGSTTFTLPSVDGGVYNFYSIATDAAGNVEASGDDNEVGNIVVVPSDTPFLTLQNDLVIYYHFDETSGNVIEDVADSDGVQSASVIGRAMDLATTAGVVGSAFHDTTGTANFAAIDTVADDIYTTTAVVSQLQFGDNATGTDFSISCWIKPISLAEGNVRLMGNVNFTGGWGTRSGVGMLCDGPAPEDNEYRTTRFRIHTIQPSTGDALDLYGGALDDFTQGQWRLMTLVVERGAGDNGTGLAKVYVDGVVVNTSSFTANMGGSMDSASVAWMFGRCIQTSDAVVAFDEFAVWHRPLEPGEVTYIYSAGIRGYEFTDPDSYIPPREDPSAVHNNWDLLQ
ncbi:laminin G domain-containing protein, partial [Candidatus Sumerlaeota bacterium]|nr:laminin G domain-containing protein [Candidatus Sumerlaeota bacterium]